MVRLQNSQTTSLRSKTRDENSTLVPGRDRGFISAGIYSPDGGESSATIRARVVAVRRESRTLRRAGRGARGPIWPSRCTIDRGVWCRDHP